jgi:hypothetical protein
MTWRSRWGEGFGDLDAADGWNLYGSANGRALEDGGGGIPSNNRGPFLVQQVDAAGGPGWVSQDSPPDRFRVRPGELLRVRGWTVGAGDATLWRVGVAFFTAAGPWIDTPEATGGPAGGGAWEAFEGTVTVPANAATGAVVLTATPDPPNVNLGWRGWDELVVEAWEPASLLSTAGTNLLGNGGFRSRDGLVRQPSTWKYDAGTAVMTLARVCGEAEAAYVLADGDYMAADEALGGSSAILEGTGPASGAAYPQWRQTVAVTEARRYVLRGLLAGEDGTVAYVAAFPRKGDAVTPSGTETYLGGLLAGRPGGPERADWWELEGALVTPPGTRFLDVHVQVAATSPAHFRALFDQVGLYEEAAPDRWDIEDDAYRSSLPYPAVYIGPGTVDKPTKRYEHLVRSASWQLGRSWWFGSPEVGTASVELEGDRHEIVPGDVCSFARDPLGTLWVGRVDDVTLEERVEAGEVVALTRVSATDATGWLAGTKFAAWAGVAEPFAARLAKLYAKAGAVVSTKAMPSASSPADFTPATFGTAAAPIDGIELLEVHERSRNAISQLGPDGQLRYLVRDALPTDLSGVATPVPLVGDDAPTSAQLDRAAVGKVVNLWRFTDGEELYSDAIPEGGTSASRYGTREYDTKTTKAAGAPIYKPAMRAVVARALPAFLVTVKVHRRAQPFAGLGPFDLVEHGEYRLQALQLAHKVDPGSWVVTASLDATQTAIVGGAVETTPPAPVRKRATVTLTADKDGYAVRTNSGSNSGNGASGNFLVGLLADGHLCRGFVGFPRATFLGRNRKVVSATLTLTTNRGGCMQWGSAPKVLVDRVTATWSEGTHATACSFITGNSLKYPGPAATSSGRVTASIPAADSRAVNIRIDAIAQAWLDGASQYGVRLLGASESSANNRAAFDAAGSGRAKLVIVYEYDE